MTREELAEQATVYRDQDKEFIQRLESLKRMKKVNGLLEAGYDWIATVIAEMGRDMFGRALS